MDEPISFFSIYMQEAILVVAIIAMQLYFFFGTLSKIRKIRQAIPEEESLKVTTAYIPNDVMEEDSPKMIVDTMSAYFEDPAADASPRYRAKARAKRHEVPFINTTTRKEPLFKRILISLNTYLLKNKGAVADFHLIKNVVERNLDSLDQDIRITLPVPLYLGLMGTMAGIIIGLFNMPDLGMELLKTSADGTPDTTDASSFSEGINILMGGVKIAMIASLAGLTLTTINSGIFYKGSKAEVENRKNGFYSFVQAELLPVLSLNVNAGLQAWTQKLVGFNDRFEENLGTLNDSVDRSFKALSSQQAIMDKLESSKFNEVIKKNLEVFQKIEESVDNLIASAGELRRFNEYFHNINDFVGNSEKLNGSVMQLMDRTDNFHTIATKVSDSLDTSKELQTYLNTHFEEVKTRERRLTETVADVDVALGKGLTDLKDATRTRMKEFKDFMEENQINVEEAIESYAKNLNKFFADMEGKTEDLVKENQSAFQKLNYLENLNKNFEKYMTDQNQMNQKMLQAFASNSNGKQVVPAEKVDEIALKKARRAEKFRNGLTVTFLVTGVLGFLSMFGYFLNQQFNFF